MEYVDLVAIIAVLQFLFFGAMTGKAREKTGLKGPAVTGNHEFECMYRVQMNTLELLVIFLPALYIASKYWSSMIIAGIGIVYVIGRVLYWRAYVTEPSKRGPGFMLSIIPAAILAVMALIGIIMSMLGM